MAEIPYVTAIMHVTVFVEYVTHLYTDAHVDYIYSWSLFLVQLTLASQSSDQCDTILPQFICLYTQANPLFYYLFISGHICTFVRCHQFNFAILISKNDFPRTYCSVRRIRTIFLYFKGHG